MSINRKSPWSFTLCCLPLLCFSFCSCKRDGLLLNEKRGSVDVSSFVANEIVTYGGASFQAARLTPSGVTNYVYSEDKDGFQIVCLGNKVAVLCNVFQSQFGTPALSTTNAKGLASFVYAVTQTGVAINCGLDSGIIDGATQEVTQLVVVKASALK